MNERIRELRKQAIDYCLDNGIPGTRSRGRLSEEVGDKFAELIIQECIDACNSRVGNSDYNTGRMHCISDIKERFRSKQIHDLQRDIRKWKSYGESQ